VTDDAARKIAHETRTPVSVITLWADRAIRQIGRGTATDDLLDQAEAAIAEATNRLAAATAALELDGQPLGEAWQMVAALKARAVRTKRELMETRQVITGTRALLVRAHAALGHTVNEPAGITKTPEDPA